MEAIVHHVKHPIQLASVYPNMPDCKYNTINIKQKTIANTTTYTDALSCGSNFGENSVSTSINDKFAGARRALIVSLPPNANIIPSL